VLEDIMPRFSLLSIGTVIVLAAVAVACNPSPTATPLPRPTATATPAAAVSAKQYPIPPAMIIDTAKKYVAVMDTTKGTIELELFAKEAPKTVNNFVFLAKDGYYDGVKFHRIMKGFMIQGGDPTGTGSGGPGYQFEDEPVTRDYEPGILAMANHGADTNGSQFFIMHGSAPQLAKDYTIFGQVIEGMDVVDAIANTPVGYNARGDLSRPLEDVAINTITIQES
jgi:peptidylprolyl isomerase